MGFREGDLNHCRRQREAAASPLEPGPTLAALAQQEVPMLKALLTPIVLGLAVAMIIRLTRPRRAY
jgi:hypothetical protein